MSLKKRKLGRGVAVVGAGLSKFGAYPREVRTTDLFVEAFNDLKQSIDKAFDPKAIEAFYLGNISSDLFEHQLHVAPATANRVGLVPVPCYRIEDACASSGVAFREGIMAIASGAYDIVLVGGTEKMTNLDTAEVTATLAAALDPDTEVPAGQTFPGIYATMATAHMAEYHTTEEDLMRIGIKNHYHGSLNPKAHFDVSIAEFMKRRARSAVKKGLPEPHWEDEIDFMKDPKQNPIIAWPMRLFDCSTICDGASCVLLVAEDFAQDFSDRPIYVAGTGQASDYFLAERQRLTTINATRLAATEAYEMAGVTPQDIKMAEVHDCFTIAELLALEDLGFYEPGQATKAIREEETKLDGKLPINTDGGLLSCGHPLGATGIRQGIEIMKQLQGRATNQVKDAHFGLTHNLSGVNVEHTIVTYGREPRA